MGIYGTAAVITAMKVQEVILKAIAGEYSWITAAKILRMSPRSLRRWKVRFEKQGSHGLLDRRAQRPSHRRIRAKVVEEILQLYHKKYQGFNVKHFHEKLSAEHKLEVSYSSTLELLHNAGYVKKHKKRDTHRLRRERKACIGEMLHIDGSFHPWLALCPQKKQSLICIIDDASSEILYARLEVSESTQTVVKGLYAVFATHGLPISLYSDRASWAFYTPKAGGKICRERPTEVGKMLARLGVETIAAYSPQARGRSERAFRTLQDRWVNELKLANITDVAEANEFIQNTLIPQHNQRFAVKAKEDVSMFIAVKPKQLYNCMTLEQTRRVQKNNTVQVDNQTLQIPKQSARRTCALRKVTIKTHVDHFVSIVHAQQLWACFDPLGNPIGKQARKIPPLQQILNQTIITHHNRKEKAA